ncbi:MAG: type II toxin-antitoxin system RelE/ParE family toxin [Bacteroidia bacterium]|nr:type II toxin-antitoxin system RelE/ParE family toxin [Bacteroidia bacterium]
MVKHKKELPIEWDINEREQFKELIKSIKNRSERLAQRIKEEVKRNLDHVKQNPKIFEADTLKTDNDGSYRKFTTILIRISYKIDSDKIIIARVRYAASEPIDY